MFTWLKNRRRRKLLAGPMPAAWEYALQNVAYFHYLTAAEQARVRDGVRILIAEKTWEGCRGLELTEEMQVTIAAMACVMILGMEGFYFDNVQTVLVNPGSFKGRERRWLADGIYLEEDTERLGEAHHRGPVKLAWDEVHLDATDPGQGCNLVFHEFAHQLDMLNGEFDGVPSLPAELGERWQTVMAREFARLQKHADRGRATLIDPYGATDPAEFFAVVSETFFDLPGQLQGEHPELYDLFRDYYGQDPAQWANRPM